MELLFVSFIASTSTVLTFQCRRECTFVAFEKFSAKKNHQSCSRQHNLVTTELRIYETAVLARGVSHIYHPKNKNKLANRFHSITSCNASFRFFSHPECRSFCDVVMIPGSPVIVERRWREVWILNQRLFFWLIFPSYDLRMWLHATHRSIEIEVGHGTHGGLFDGKYDHGYSIRPWIFSRGGPAFGCVERGDKGKCPSVVIYSPSLRFRLMQTLPWAFADAFPMVSTIASRCAVL